MFKNKFIIALAGVALAVAIITFNPFTIFEKAAHNTLTIGLQSGYPPFEFVDEKGHIVGFDVDVAAHIANKMGKNLVIKDMEFEGEILSLKQGKIDLIISGMNITPARMKEISLIPYYGETTSTLSLIFWKEIPPNIQSLKDLSNAIVSVESGTVPETYLAKFPDIKTKSFQGSLAPLMDVKYGKSIANLVQPEVAEFLQKNHPEVKILNIQLTEEDSILGFGIGVNKKNIELQNHVQNIVQDLQATGTLDQLKEKWFKGGANV